MADRWDVHAWELVRALAAIEPSQTPGVALQVLDEMREQAMALLAARHRHTAIAQGERGPLFGLAPAAARIGPAEEVEWDLPPYMCIPRD